MIIFGEFVCWCTPKKLLKFRRLDPEREFGKDKLPNLFVEYLGIEFLRVFCDNKTKSDLALSGAEC